MIQRTGAACVLLAIGVALLTTLGCNRRESGEGQTSNSAGSESSVTAAVSNRNKNYRGLLGSDNAKIRTEGEKTYVWAGGERSGPDARWYDFTDSPIPAGDLQFGIGKDRIPSIDDPLFVKPDDPRLMTLANSPYRRDEAPKTNDEIPVIGYVEGDEARAYPIALLDHHELVNDRIGGKPVTVGW